jgi:hypothetical protein
LAAPRWPAWWWPNHPLAKRGGLLASHPVWPFLLLFLKVFLKKEEEEENVMGAFWE